MFLVDASLLLYIVSQCIAGVTVWDIGVLASELP